MLKGFLFDLDGVITDTAKFHYLAWKKMAALIDIKIDEKFNETLKGIDRRGSIDRILTLGNLELSEQKIEELMKFKNDYYLTLLDKLTKDDILPGIEQLLIDAKSNNVKVAIASASKNAPFIIEKLGIINLIDYIANPEEAKASKPDPDIFLLAAKGINCKDNECICFEDAQAGVNAIKAANMYAISIGEGLVNSDVSFSKTSKIFFNEIKNLI